MTDQQFFFDKTVRHLLKQKERAYEPDLGCVYRGPNKTQCAVGCHIPDNLYVPEMEGRSVDNLCECWPVLNRYIPNVELARALQAVHDGELVSDWESRLRNVADRFKLTMPEGM